MDFLQGLYLFLNRHVNWDFGAEMNAKLSAIWKAIGSMIF